MKKLSLLITFLFVVFSLSFSAYAATDSKIEYAIDEPQKIDNALPSVLVIATGGTIAGSGEAGKTTGYKPGSISAQDLIASVPGIDKIANIYAYQFCNIASDNISQKEWISLANAINRLAEGNKYDGFVITHGTDTLEETAYFLNLTVKTEKPVVVTGSMRPSTAISADGPMNLYESVALATSPDAKNMEVMLVFADKIFGARDVQKINSHITDAFSSRDFGCIGYMHDVVPYIFYKSNKLSKKQTEFDVSDVTELPKVEIAYFAIDADSGILDYYLKSGARGIIIAGAGDGSTSSAWTDIINKSTASGFPIVRTSRTGAGVVNHDPDYKNTILGSNLNAQKAKILLMLSLLQTSDTEKIQENFNKY